jgi:hypothetical protein
MAYGRYWDGVMPVISLIGIAALGSTNVTGLWARARAGLVATAAAGLLLALWRQRDIDNAIERDGSLRPGRRVLGLEPYLDNYGLPVFWITVVAVIIGVVVVLVALHRPGGVDSSRRATAGLLLVVLAIANARADQRIDARENRAPLISSVTELDEGVLPPGAVIAMGPDRGGRFWRWTGLQFYLPENEFRMTDDHVLDSGADFGLAPFGDSRLAQSGAEPIWSDPRSDLVLWRLPSRENSSP